MKRLNFLLVSMIILTLFSCSKDSLEGDIKNTAVNDESIKIEAGLAHNLILDEFFDNFDKNSTNKQGKISVAIATIDDYLLNQGSDVKFSDIYYNNSDFKYYLDEIINAGTDIETMKDIFKEIHRNNGSKQIILDTSLELMDIMLNYEGTQSLESELKIFEQMVKSTKDLTSDEKNYILMSIDVARLSNIYWHDNDNNYVPNGFGDIAGADAAGAVMAVQTGTVFYATVGFGIWGGFAALVGGAALTSILAA